jgi:hypothetical protein
MEHVEILSGYDNLREINFSYGFVGATLMEQFKLHLNCISKSPNDTKQHKNQFFLELHF